ncbi:outer membrane porin GjpA [Mycolicibacter sp. MYC123]|uniref:Outer membrane porin GjpA n=1 Tax=[Mycobacterium] zoologicum TaxID=2872311 RepID=A0ABU5YKS5_9MYCO|nr:MULTISPECIES: outer membrane porin GjpA [unclassified Mycolicibacter]MEB3050505.1 outer membrane porin GjpA [Mycolicibacter sp. MYC123]MEB3063019.1 outer membrane porin GjpA [Mycolicibacter sp. MYC101]
MAVQQTLRPYVTAGVAIVGASLIAATPVVAPAPEISAVRDVALTASSAWDDVFNTASQNVTQLINNFNLAPGVAFQQFVANQNNYAQQLLDDPSNISAVTEQIRHNLDGLLTGYALNSPSDETLATVLSHTLYSGGSLADLGWYDLFVGSLASIAGGLFPADMIPIIHMLSSPLSGIIMGSLGPMISPMVALLNSVTDHDSFSDTLANVFGASLNGATLDLDPMLPLINQIAGGLLPAGLGISHLEIAFGGLLTAGDVAINPYQVAGPDGSLVDATPAVGGSILNSVGIGLTGVPILGNLDLSSHAIGPIGAMEAWSQTAGALLGSGWDGKGAVPVAPPLSDSSLPLIDDGGAGSGAASDMFADLLAGIGL